MCHALFTYLDGALARRRQFNSAVDLCRQTSEDKSSLKSAHNAGITACVCWCLCVGPFTVNIIKNRKLFDFSILTCQKLGENMLSHSCLAEIRAFSKIGGFLCHDFLESSE